MSRIDELIAEMCPDGVPHKMLGEIGQFQRGRRFTKADVVEDGIPSIHYGEIYTDYGVSAAETVSHIRADMAARLRFARPGDVVIAGVGETVEDVGKGVAWLGTEDAAIHDDCFLYRHSMDPKYVSYFLQTEAFRSQKRRYVARAKVKRLSAQALAGITIPVPPLEVQREIVRVLDTFTALEAELEAELVAELEARRRQHAHYRDALLTFSEGGVRWVPMGEAVFNLDSRRRPVARACREAGEYPYYGANGVQDFVSDYLFEGTFLLIGEDGSVVGHGGEPVVNWATGKIWVNNHAHVLIERSGMVHLRFLYFFLQTVKIGPYVTGGTQPKLNQKNMNAIPVPVLSLEEQARIVAILDKFDALVNDLSSGLPAELAARRKQYEYYRDRLLTFKEAAA